MASADQALDHLEIGAAELLATAPDGWTERQIDRLAAVREQLKDARFEYHKGEYLRRTARARGAR
jgi:hypothetical protein